MKELLFEFSIKVVTSDMRVPREAQLLSHSRFLECAVFFPLVLGKVDLASQKYGSFGHWRDDTATWFEAPQWLSLQPASVEKQENPQ